jgi:hypothetical protein
MADKMIKSSIIPFNGAFYTKDGNINNLDGTRGPGSNASDLLPFTGVFIGSDGKEHDITEIKLFGGGGGEDEGLRDKSTILMGDPEHYQISRLTIIKPGRGYIYGDALVISHNGTDIPLSVESVDADGGVTNVSFGFIISDMNFATGTASIPGVGGTGSGATFHISTSYAIGSVTIQGKLKHVPDSDPLIQYTFLIGYFDARLAQYFPITTNQIADQAVTAGKIDDAAIYPGDGILISKTDKGIQISAVPTDYEAVTITFYNTDQNGDPI